MISVLNYAIKEVIENQDYCINDDNIQWYNKNHTQKYYWNKIEHSQLVVKATVPVLK